MNAIADEIDDWTEGGMTITQACEFTTIGRTKLYDEMNAGRLAYRKHGTRRIVSRSSLVRLMSIGSPSRVDHRTGRGREV